MLTVPLLEEFECTPRANGYIASIGGKIVVGHLHQDTEVVEAFLEEVTGKITCRWVVTF